MNLHHFEEEKDSSPDGLLPFNVKTTNSSFWWRK